MASDPSKRVAETTVGADDTPRRMRDLLDQIAPARLPDAQLLRHVKELIATMPPRELFVARLPPIAPWVGEACSVIERWNSLRAVRFRMSIENIGTALDFNGREYPAVLAILHEARFEVELRGEVPTAALIDEGKVHDYFERARQLIGQAKSDLLITDRHLNADFVARYMPFVAPGARVRLLVRNPDRTLMPAVGPSAAQLGLAIQVRAHSGVHDRYIFIDGLACYMSGASFADGGKTGPTAVIPVLEFEHILARYEAMWSEGGAQT